MKNGPVCAGYFKVYIMLKLSITIGGSGKRSNL